MRSEFSSFAALLAAHREGEDFDRTIVCREAAMAVLLAPHGGRIEPHTAEIATEIAGDTFSLYCFRSRRRRAEANLHITSHHFDDPECVDLVAKHASAIAIHGCRGGQSRALIGGLDSDLIAELAAALLASGISARVSGHAYPGSHPMNICNRTALRAGVQFELTMPLRTGPQRASFVASVRSVLLARQGAASSLAAPGTPRA